MNLSARTLTKLARPADARTKLPVRFSALLVVPVLLTACAQAPKSTVDEPQFGTLSCAELAQQAEEGSASKAVADQAKSDSWRAVVPFIVAARYGQAAFASSEAEKRLALLTQQSTRLGCVL
ncbi:hypothetical protein [Stutzerimonas azotifigens]|uniref:Lipoprotein n=1 Tax=Stutzerimonas azotifigens TaxID=291995 RepID=A0ABR5YZJ0_9GAMM|nr:hypothetical protein [Stutzerimonas azotifigens]MBA1273368.1 hypothetical protein [Stutzerimonas azotifigens]